ncbi:N(6)-adenosine-methyltransferase catalytic subunit METTL3-like [Babylonia areolata]|uniref:N(6)-adenosine-methyltransferase catalytic subunit METTL3-like n=1 Tax=Babylonia areolata TaxID=304850 RepID=UPI003FD3C0B0
MSDPWNDILTVKDRKNTLRAKMMQRKKEREGLVAELTGETSAGGTSSATAGSGGAANTASDSQSGLSSQVSAGSVGLIGDGKSSSSTGVASISSPSLEIKVDPEIEKKLLLVLCDISLDIPSDASIIAEHTSRTMGCEVELSVVENLLRKFASQSLISVIAKEVDGKTQLTVISLDITKLEAVSGEKRKRSRESLDGEEKGPPSKAAKAGGVDDIETLLSMQSTKEREEKKTNEEILQLLSKPTAKEKYLVEKFKTPGGAQLKEFCQFGVKEECRKYSQGVPCNKLHFRKIIQKHTDESLGDCSFLNTCFHMDTCKYVHYEVETVASKSNTELALLKREATLAKQASEASLGDTVRMFPPQYVQCDLRTFDMSVLGKCAVVMADPPWDIHMELPYGTMGDDEMRRLDIPSLQDEGFIFLWVTGRAMELGRECLELWGYKRCDEIIWVKTNQLQRIIRTGRTGHWLNHGKEHCLVGVKGNPKGVNKGLDCDVIVAEVRATSHKPDEIYGIIERLSPGTRKVELFGRPHNVQPNWITLGNQLEGVCLKDPDIVKMFREKYPDGNCMTPPKGK